MSQTVTPAHEGARHHPDMPASGPALTSIAISATLHCLTGCAVGEVLGMVIGTALGFSDLGTIALAVGLAFLFGYGLTSLPLLRAGLALSAVVPIALASDTLSIAVMEAVDNGVMLAVPGAMEAGVGSLLFWGSLSFALVVAGAVALPVNRWLIARGRGHAVLHQTGIHGGPSPRVVGIVAAAAFAFGVTVLVAGGGGAEGGHGGEVMAAPVRGLAVSEGGMTLSLDRTEVSRGERSVLNFSILDGTGSPVRAFEVEHDKRMHLIVVRRDLTAFQHLHPRMGADGTWITPLRLDEGGAYRVFADFKRDGRNHTLAADLAVDGPVDWRALPAARGSAGTSSGLTVDLASGGDARIDEETELRFTPRRGGEAVAVEPYLGARGHLVALREGDLAFLHVHPTEEGAGPIGFETRFPSAGRYRLFLQFKQGGRVHTAAYTLEVGR